jgi:hypothetical protein
MIAVGPLAELVETYERYGWELRRVVVTTKDALPEELITGLDGVSISEGLVDAAWFSRPPKPGPIPWEIRYLGPTPFALVEHLDEESPDFEEQLRRVEERLLQAVTAKRSDQTTP